MLKTAWDAFPVVASLPEGEKRRPEMRLRFAGYEWSSCSSSHKQARKQSSEASLIKYVDFSILSVERKFSQA